MKNEIKELAKEYFNEIVQIRRYLHKHPELSFQEENTSKYIQKILKKWGVKFKTNYAKTGIVGVIKGKSYNSNVTALRADFDALPILEENDIDYCSLTHGVMHACGHDAHTASLLGTIKILNRLKDHWKGTVKFIFQPAEERLPGGAKQMIKDGVLKSPNVNQIFGQHVYPDLEKGKVGFKTGEYMASTDEIYINIQGVGGHAALPLKTVNPIVISTELINLLYKYFDAERNRPSIFSIGYINAQGSTNIIPKELDMMGTFRCIDDNWRFQAHKDMLEIANKIEVKYKIEINFEIRIGYPSLYNNKELTLQSIKLAKDFLGEKKVVELPLRMTAEDFAYYTKEIPGCFYRLGTANHKAGITHNLHTSKFNIDEESLELGMGLMAWLAICH
ncbi:MAG: M20 family metallopeptidase [Bacteroidota bacterium]|nr:M20 family metallopeptidase [Bacteroidota bacterium]